MTKGHCPPPREVFRARALRARVHDATGIIYLYTHVLSLIMNECRAYA